MDKKPEKNGYETLYDEKKAVTLFRMRIFMTVWK